MEKHPLHLKNPELQTSPEVDRAVKRQERHTDEKVPNDPSERIEAYMDRLENIFLNPDERVRTRNLEMFRDKIYDALIIKRGNFPESYFSLQKRIARERGQPVEEISADVREQMKDVAIEDQKASLDAWIEYLTEEDVAYPAWFKFLFGETSPNFPNLIKNATNSRNERIQPLPDSLTCTARPLRAFLIYTSR